MAQYLPTSKFKWLTQDENLMGLQFERIIQMAYIRSWSWLSRKVAQFTQLLTFSSWENWNQRRYVIKLLQKNLNEYNISCGGAKKFIPSLQ